MILISIITIVHDEKEISMTCRSETLAQRGPIAVLRCACGSLHVRVGHTSLGFDEAGLTLLASVLAEALPELAPSEPDRTTPH